MKRKLFIPLLALTFALTFAACGEDNKTSSSDKNNSMGDSSNIISDITGGSSAMSGVSSEGEASSNHASSNQSGTISRDKAKEIALNHAGVTADKIYDFEIDFDRDNGVPSYEIDFKSDKTEYEYDIHSETGEILKSEKGIID